MLTKTILSALNKQINHEMNAAYNYLAMEAWFHSQNLAGFAQWMKVQRDEELEHARKLFDFVHDRGGEVELGSLAKPNGQFTSPRDVFAHAAKLEQGNTKAIHDLYALAVGEHDYATQSMLQWFIDEQVEEEKSTSEITALLEMAGDNQSALLLLNEKFGKRSAEAED